MYASQKYIIVKDRVEIYKDFALNLLFYITDYYLDNVTLSADEDIYNHYSWCYGKVCTEFNKENLDFTNNKKLKQYFYKYYYHQFYTANENQDTTLDYLEKFWRSVFDIDKQKNKNILNLLIELYDIYDVSVSEEKNILEIV